MELDRNPDGDGAGQKLGNISLGGTCRLGPRRLPASGRALCRLISTHGPDLAIIASVRGRGWCGKGREGGVNISGRGGSLATIPIPEHRKEPRKPGGSWSGPDVGLGRGGSGRIGVGCHRGTGSRAGRGWRWPRPESRSEPAPRSDSGRLPPGFARTHSSATGPPRNPRRSAAATARPRLVFATVSWRLLPPAHTRSLRPFPHSRAVSDSFLADFNRQVSEQHATIFDWSDRLRTCRIPTSGKVPSIAEFHGMRRMKKKGRRPARGSWRSELVP